MKYKCGIVRGSKNAGFTTVYLLLILSSLIMAVVMIINAACGYAARSIVNNVCAVCGRSVLSEFQKDLFRRYGIFALRGDEAVLTKLSGFYIKGSLDLNKALVRPSAQEIKASSEGHPALDVDAFGQQVRRLAPAAALLKGDILDFVLSNADEGPTGLAKETAGTAEGENAPEAIEDLSGAADKEFGRDKEKSKKSISDSDYAELPSQLLGYHQRSSALLSGGIKDISFAAVTEDEYIMAMCSNKCSRKDETVLDYETEYIIYGKRSDAANLRNVKLSLFAIRFAVNEVKYYAETVEILVATASAIAKSVGEVRTILSGKSVDHPNYSMYLRILLALIPRNEKMARLMDIMQLNVCKLDNARFSFRNYAYGFELNAVFTLKGREGDVVQEFVYQ